MLHHRPFSSAPDLPEQNITFECVFMCRLAQEGRGGDKFDNLYKIFAMDIFIGKVRSNLKGTFLAAPPDPADAFVEIEAR